MTPRLTLSSLAALGLVGAATPGLTLAQYERQSVRLYSQVDLSDFGQSFANDCWGYVSPSGREYAIIGLYDATGFVDITDPVNPQILLVEPHSTSFTGDIKVYQHYAYSIGDGYNMQIFDMSDIDNGVVTRVGTENLRTHNIALNPESGYAYLLASSVNSGITAVDLSDPVNPVVRGSTNPTGNHVHDAQVVNYTSGQYAGREIAFCPSGQSGFDIIEVTNHSSMSRLSHLTYQGLSYSHQGWLSEDRQYFYLNDELDELNGHTPTTRTLVFDVSDLSNPFLASTFTTGEGTTDHNLYVHEGFVYESNYNSGFHVFDARTDPLSPTEVGYFDTYPENNSVGYGDGAWSNYPFFPSGVVIVSDVNRGLFVLDVSEARGERMGLQVSNLVAGQDATLSVSGATPNATVYFAYSLTGGESMTWIDALGVYLNLQNPALGGSATANGAGDATLVKRVPAQASGRTVWMQAAEAGNTSIVAEGAIQ
ncbi:MAG: choice-of-anchor B family protein [Phycisphaerales bacterium]